VPEIALSIGPEGCPECGSTRAVLGHVTPESIRRKCAECGHKWAEERVIPEVKAGPEYRITRPGFIEVGEIDRVARLREDDHEDSEA
jgi:hypothetical protein